MLTEAKQNVAEQIQADFAAYGIALSFTPCALREVACRAATQGTGARGLLTILEAALRPYNFELPSHAVRSLKVNAQMIREPQAQLERLLERLELGSKE